MQKRVVHKGNDEIYEVFTKKPRKFLGYKWEFSHYESIMFGTEAMPVSNYMGRTVFSFKDLRGGERFSPINPNDTSVNEPQRLTISELLYICDDLDKRSEKVC